MISLQHSQNLEKSTKISVSGTDFLDSSLSSIANSTTLQGQGTPL